MTTSHLYMIRHGDYDIAQLDGKYQDCGLTAQGRQQAERLRDRLLRTQEMKPDVLIVSSKPRAIETAEILAPALNIPMILDDLFVEWDNEDGSLDMETFNRMWQDAPLHEKPFFRWVEGYENWIEFFLRMQLALNRVLKEHPNKSMVIVAHGGVIQATFDYFLGIGLSSFGQSRLPIKHTSINHWLKSDSRDHWTLERLNDYSHLE